MSANDTARPALRQTIEDLDQALYRLEGTVAALQVLSGDLGADAASPTSSAFWAILAGAEGFIAQAQSASDSIHEQTKGVSK